jgi:ubiquitin C-terminal hydrolase
MGVTDAGHYLSFAKHNGVWHLFNDGNVTEVDE